MPTSLSAKKRIRQASKRRLRNRSVMSNLRTHIKKCEKAIAEKNVEGARVSFREMESKLDRAASKGIIHRNAASRKKARIAARLKKLAEAS